MKMNTLYLLLGSNLYKPEAQLRLAERMIAEEIGIVNLKKTMIFSVIFQTEWFLDLVKVIIIVLKDFYLLTGLIHALSKQFHLNLIQ